MVSTDIYPTQRRYEPDSPELLESIRDSQLKGYSQRVTASLAGIAKSTLILWLSTGKEQLAAFDSGDELGSHGRFASVYLRAASEREAANSDDIVASIHDKSVNFVPALIMNKARNPADWLEARADTLTITASVTYTHELGPGAQKAIAAHMMSLQEPDGGVEVNHGGSETSTTPLLTEGLSDSQ